MKKIFTVISVCLFVFGFTAKSSAQSALIHYWHFNNYNQGKMYTDTFITGTPADFSTQDTAKVKILYQKIAGTSAFYHTYVDSVTVQAGTPDYDTVNPRLGALSGFALRVRNPSDSMQLLFYVPSVHYTHITLKYGSESSSITHGQLHQNFSYSTDSGLTWRTSGLSMLSDSAWTVFHRTTVGMTTDSSVKNNSKLVFRIIFSGNTTGTSGNNRFDNVTVEGDSVIPSTLAIAASTYTLCAGTTVHFTATATTTGVTPYYHWYVNGVNVGTDSSTYSTSSLTTGALVKCVVTDSVDGSVLATSNTITMTVTATPVVAPITGPTNVCPSATINLVETTSGGTWTRSNTTATVNSTGAVTGVSTGTDTISYTVMNACGTTVVTHTVIIANVPSPGIISGGANACIGLPDALAETVSGGVWSASNGNATVTTAGIVTGVASGNDTIKYTVTTCGTSDTTFIVSVGPAPSAGVISGASTICVDSVATLAETVTGGVWSSSNAAVTITTDGTITGVSTGSVVITYSVTNSCATVDTSFDITVNAVASTGTITATSDSVCVGYTLALSDLAPGGSWVALNGNASVNILSGVVTGVTPGIDTIAYGIVNPCGIAYSLYTVNVRPASSCMSGVAQVGQSTEVFRAYPNPAVNGTFTLICSSQVNEMVQVTVSNMVGGKIKEISMPANQPTEINIDQPAGIYIINAATSHGKYTAKIVIAH